MLRAVVLAGVLLFHLSLVFVPWPLECRQSFGQPASVEILRVEYRNAKVRGETKKAIDVLRRIVAIVPEDCDWRIKLAEDLFRAGGIEDARAEFAQILEIEPEFLEAGIGVARTFAVQNNACDAKAEMLHAARSGYRVALMMRRRELAPFFKDHEFVIRLLEADRLEITQVRDPFANPLRPRGPEPDPTPRPKPREKLSAREQWQIVNDAKCHLEAAQMALANDKSEEALHHYRAIEAAYAKKKLFTKEGYIEILEETHLVAEEVLYPRIEALLRAQTVQKARDLFEKLYMAVEKRDRGQARTLNEKLLGVVKKALESKDGLLEKEIKAIDAERAKAYKTVEILDEFDSKVRPGLALRGTITGSAGQGSVLAFFEVETAGGRRGMVLAESDEFPGFDNLRVLKIDEDLVRLRYRDVLVKMEIGREAAFRQKMPTP